MRKGIFVLMLVVAGVITHAQCDKKFLLYASKTEYLDNNKTVQRTVDENTVIEISKSELSITPGSEENKMTGLVKSTVCNWKTPFQEGKTVIKTALSDPGGDTKNVTITIEGKEGKLTLLAEIDDEADKKIRVAIDKFEEKG